MVRAKRETMVNKQECEGIGGKVVGGVCKVDFDDYKCKNVGGEFKEGVCELSKEKLNQTLKKVNSDIEGNVKLKKE